MSAGWLRLEHRVCDYWICPRILLVKLLLGRAVLDIAQEDTRLLKRSSWNLEGLNQYTSFSCMRGDLLTVMAWKSFSISRL
jgi:hypothetical protein